jgi:hypothetical protein
VSRQSGTVSTIEYVASVCLSAATLKSADGDVALTSTRVQCTSLCRVQSDIHTQTDISTLPSMTVPFKLHANVSFKQAARVTLQEGCSGAARDSCSQVRSRYSLSYRSLHSAYYACASRSSQPVDLRGCVIRREDNECRPHIRYCTHGDLGCVRVRSYTVDAVTGTCCGAPKATCVVLLYGV